jgi:hypothetical protein
MRLLMSLVLMFTLSGCASLQGKGDTWITFKAEDNAAETLAKALEGQGFITELLNDSQVEVIYDQSRYIMEPRIQTGRLSRIVVSQVYPIKAEHQNNPEIFITLSRLNTHLNCAKYIVQPGNKAAEVQSSMTFIDERLSVREVEYFMAWMQNRIRQASTLVPDDTLRMFEF